VKNCDRVLVVAYVVMLGGCPHNKYSDVVVKCTTSAECKSI
jgi:hypothetical protein